MKFVFLFDALFDARQLQRFDADNFIFRSTLIAGYHVALFYLLDIDIQCGFTFRAARHC